MNSPEAVATRLLADAGALRSLDRGGMLAILENLPRHIRHAVELAKRFECPVPGPVRNVVVTGLGGSAIGGELVQSLLARRCAVAISVNREYQVPGFVGEDCLLVACSYSGNTEETLAAYQSALQRKAKIVAITSGGELAQRAQHDRIPLLRIPAGYPPRAALGYSVFAILWILHSAGVWEWQEQIAEETAALCAAQVERYRPEADAGSNIAKQVALRLHHGMPVIYAPAHPLGAVATRWKGQLCENAKTLAMHNVLPEMTHNEIIGWKHPELIRQARVVCLRDREEHPRVTARFDFLVRHLRSVPVPVEQCWGEGESLLARIFSLIVLGDYVSVYLAFLYSEDPTPVTVIEQLKQTLKATP